MFRLSTWGADACLATLTLLGWCLPQVPAIGGGGDPPVTPPVAHAGPDRSDAPQVIVAQVGTVATPDQQTPTAAPAENAKPAQKEECDEPEYHEPEYRTRIAEKIADKLDADVSIELETTLDSLADVLSSQLGFPVLVDVGAIEQAELSPSQVSVTFQSDDQPLRSSLRQFLQPLGLRAEIQDEGLVITADFTELTRRGILADKWVGLSDELIARVDKALATKVALPHRNISLDRAIAEFSLAVEFPMTIRQTALEGIGLTQDVPVRGHPRRTTSQLAPGWEGRLLSKDFAETPQTNVTPVDDPLAANKNAKADVAKSDAAVQKLPLGEALNYLLEDLELTYTVRDGMIQVTTRDDAETRLLPRLYFLEGTGLPRGELGSAMSMIQTSIDPDTWEALGGVSTMTPVGNGEYARPALLISTTFHIHQQIADLMQSLRESHVGPDPIWSGRPPCPATPPGMIGGMGGGGGGMGGGMGGMGGGMF